MRINGYNFPRNYIPYKAIVLYPPSTKFGAISLLLNKEEGRRKKRGMAAIATASSSLSTSIEVEQLKSDLRKQIRSHEVAIAELNSLSSSRAVYQKNINILFRTSIPKATVNEQKQLDLAKAKLQKLNGD